MEVPAIEVTPELAPQIMETGEIPAVAAPKEISVTEASAEVKAEVAEAANSNHAQEERKASPASTQTTPATDPAHVKPDIFSSARRVPLKVSPESRLVALSDPNSMGAEKFRSLVTRLERLHEQSDVKSFQVTSSVIHEGKTLVSGNVAVTLARHFGAKTLLVEGDLHRPSLGTILGLNKMRGLSHWWSGWNDDLAPYIYKMGDLPLWFLSAGNPADRPSDILRSPRFVKAFAQLKAQFEWTVVDSTPIIPIVDVNLWSRIVDGTLLVVREGVTPVKALKQGLRTLDHPNLIGVVLNEADTTNEVKYAGDYYGTPKRK
jgi:receptor protein-tyrosine kinase